MTLNAQTRTLLLDLHGALLEHERRDYEKVHGRVSGADFLRALIHEPAFGWLAPLTALIARLDGAEDGGETAPDAASTLDSLRQLISLVPDRSEFHRKYAELVEQDPEVAFAHGAAFSELRRTAAKA